MTVLWTVLLIPLGILILVTGLLLVPVCFSCRAGIEDTAYFRGLLAWGGKLVVLEASAVGGQPAAFHLRMGRLSRGLQRGKPKARKHRPGRKSGSPGSTVRSLLDRQVLKEAIKYLLQMKKSLGLKISIEGEVGFDEPHLTGYLAGLLGVISAGPWECGLRPNFTGTELRIRGEVKGRAVPARLLWLTVRFLLSPPIRKVWFSRLRMPRIKGQRPYKEVIGYD